MSRTPWPHRVPSRPIAPRCRGGASSLLRLSGAPSRLQPGRALTAWAERAAQPLAEAGHDTLPGFITPLYPSIAQADAAPAASGAC